MEKISVPKATRGRKDVVRLLNECSKSGMSIKAFCAARHIPEGTFYHWRHKYREVIHAGEKSGFASLQVTAGIPAGLFAEVRGVKIYQPVSAAYIKELLA